MSVEGGSGGVGVAGAASVSGAAIFGMPSLEAAPVVVNAGLVRSLEGFRPMNISDINPIDKGGTIAPLGEIVFQPSVPSVIEQAESVAAAAWEKSELPTPTEAVLQAEAIISQARNTLIKPVIFPQVEPRVLPLAIPKLDSQPVLYPAVSPALEPAIRAATKPATKTSYHVASAIFPQPFLQEQEIVKEVLEKVKVEEPKDELEEEEEVEKRLFLEDEKAAAVRRFEIKQAIKLAFAKAKNAKLSTVLGSLVAGFLPDEHAGNRSSALTEKGPDGSYEETVEAIASSGEFSSPEQAEKRFEEIVAEKKPIKSSIEGSPVAEEDVARVFKFRAVKPPAAVEIFTKRVVKKKVQVFAGPAVTESKPETNETSLKDYPELEEVFGKAHNVDNA